MGEAAARCRPEPAVCSSCSPWPRPLAPPSLPPALPARRDRLVAQLDLATAQRDILRQYTGFITTAQSGDTIGLGQKIDELQRSVPEVQAQVAGSGGASAANSTSPAAGTEIAA